MPDRQDDLNPGSDLAPFADALKRLAPQPPHLSRDALLFEAGKAAAAPKLAPWVWPSATGTFAALSFVLAAFLIAPGGPTEPQVVYLPAPAPPHPEPESGLMPSPPGPVVNAPKPKPSDDSAETARLLRQKRDVLRWGVDMLPESKPAADAHSSDATTRDTIHWLNLPSGTFAFPSTLPKKPVPKKDDEDQE